MISILALNWYKRVMWLWSWNIAHTRDLAKLCPFECANGAFQYPIQSHGLYSISHNFFSLLPTSFVFTAPLPIREWLFEYSSIPREFQLIPCMSFKIAVMPVKSINRISLCIHVIVIWMLFASAPMSMPKCKCPVEFYYLSSQIFRKEPIIAEEVFISKTDVCTYNVNKGLEKSLDSVQDPVPFSIGTSNSSIFLRVFFCCHNTLQCHPNLTIITMRIYMGNVACWSETVIENWLTLYGMLTCIAVLLDRCVNYWRLLWTGELSILRQVWVKTELVSCG